MIFLDEIDKIAGREGSRGPDVSREGVQRDLLPIVEGTNVSTKYGMVKTDHILFIAAGAFHVSKPSDLIPELQGRFPIRVELDALTEQDFVRILTEPETALTKQYSALLSTEGVTLEFTPDAVAEIARLAVEVNSTTENIGARRLSTLMERLLDEVSFDAPDMAGVVGQGRRRVRPQASSPTSSRTRTSRAMSSRSGGLLRPARVSVWSPFVCSPAAASRATPQPPAARRAGHRRRTSRSASRATRLLLDFTYPQTTPAGTALGGHHGRSRSTRPLRPPPREGKAPAPIDPRAVRWPRAQLQRTLGARDVGVGHVRRAPDHRPAAPRVRWTRPRREARYFAVRTSARTATARSSPNVAAVVPGRRRPRLRSGVSVTGPAGRRPRRVVARRGGRRLQHLPPGRRGARLRAPLHCAGRAGAELARQRPPASARATSTP